MRQGRKHGDTALSKKRREQASKKTAWQLLLKQCPSGQYSCICMPPHNKQLCRLKPRIQEQTNQGHSLSLVARALCISLFSASVFVCVQVPPYHFVGYTQTYQFEVFMLYNPKGNLNCSTAAISQLRSHLIYIASTSDVSPKIYYTN